MDIGVLGTGMVGETIGSALLAAGHRVMMGSRSANHDKGLAWAAQSGGRLGTFAEAATFGAMVFNCVRGDAALAALALAGADALKGKVLIDISNPLDFSNGMPPTLFVSNTDSLGEQIQRQYPETQVVKTLNTLNAHLMVNPRLLAEDHHIFLSGNTAEAKHQVQALLETSLGWKPENMIDLGDITTARGTESFLPLWIRLWGALKTPQFNIKIIRG